MPGLAEILLALMLTGGGHEMGHKLEADRQDVPMSFDNKMLWTAHTQDPEKLARISNAGFEGQDIVSGALGGKKLESSVRFMSGLNKLGYALLPGGIQGGTGDVKLIEKTSGKKTRQALQGMLLISGMSDMFNSRRPDSKLDFGIGQSNKGTPMLTFGGQF